MFHMSGDSNLGHCIRWMDFVRGDVTFRQRHNLHYYLLPVERGRPSTWGREPCPQVCVQGLFYDPVPERKSGQNPYPFFDYIPVLFLLYLPCGAPENPGQDEDGSRATRREGSSQMLSSSNRSMSGVGYLGIHHIPKDSSLHLERPSTVP